MGLINLKQSTPLQERSLLIGPSTRRPTARYREDRLHRGELCLAAPEAVPDLRRGPANKCLFRMAMSRPRTKFKMLIHTVFHAFFTP